MISEDDATDEDFIDMDSQNEAPINNHVSRVASDTEKVAVNESLNSQSMSIVLDATNESSPEVRAMSVAVNAVVETAFTDKDDPKSLVAKDSASKFVQLELRQ